MSVFILFLDGAFVSEHTGPFCLIRLLSRVSLLLHLLVLLLIRVQNGVLLWKGVHEKVGLLRTFVDGQTQVLPRLDL